MKAKGWTVTTEAQLDALEWKKTTPKLNRRTGQMLTVPVGIDPGFAYNVGIGRRAALTPPPVPQPQRDVVQGPRYPRALPSTPRPRSLPPGVERRPDLEGEAVFDAFARTLGVAEDGVFFDRVQTPLVIGPGLFQTKDAAGVALASKAEKGGRGEWAEVLAATLKDPDEIWMSAQAQADGGVRMVRTYVAAFTDPDGDRYWFSAVFAERDGWWFGVTAFPPGKAGKAENQAAASNRNMRVGSLVYRRK